MPYRVGLLGKGVGSRCEIANSGIAFARAGIDCAAHRVGRLVVGVELNEKVEVGDGFRTVGFVFDLRRPFQSRQILGSGG